MQRKRGGRGEEKGKRAPQLRQGRGRGSSRVESTQDFFRRGNRNGHGDDDDSRDDDTFSTPGKQIIRGALARSLAAACSSRQEVGMAKTLNSAKSFQQGGGIGRGGG